MLNQADRKLLLDFLSKHADGDVLIQACNRVATNIEDVPNLKKFINAYKNAEVVPLSEVDRGNARDAPTPDYVRSIPTGVTVDESVEDLGPIPKKLGTNGQQIRTLLAKHPDTDYTVDGISAAIKLVKGKVKPMLALLIERGMVQRTSHNTYRVKEV